MQKKNFMLHRFYVLLVLLWVAANLPAQALTEYETYAGQIDFVWVGTTNNLSDNSESGFDCSSGNVSSSTLNLQLPSGAVVKKAILYWAGSGSGDFDVTLDAPGMPGISLSAQRTYSASYVLLNYFGAAYDLTQVVTNAGSGDYTLSGLDADKGIFYCTANVIFSGWSLLVVYEDSSLPFAEVKVFEGLDPFRDNTRTVTASGIQIATPSGSKLAYQMWEGDVYSTTYEHVAVNGTNLSNALNPDGQVFNGSGATASNYNMDLDEFDISAAVNAGVNSLTAEWTTGGDLVLLNVVAMRYPVNQLPDATVHLDTAYLLCGSDQMTVEFTVENLGLEVLPQGMEIVFRQDNAAGPVLSVFVTPAGIAGGGAATYSTLITVPLPVNYSIFAQADFNDAIQEADETNNTATILPQVLDNQVFESFSDSICPGDSAQWAGAWYASDTTISDTFSTAAGCDSIVQWTLEVLAMSTDTVSAVLCGGMTYFLPDGTEVSQPGSYLTPDTCAHAILTLLAADSIFVNPGLPDTVEILQGQSVELEPDTSLNLSFPLWSPPEGVDCDTCLAANVSPARSTAYIFTAIKANGCEVRDTVFVKITVQEVPDVFIPNAFSPNHDGNNEVFSAFGEKVESIVQMQIFDRWGSLIFAAENLPPGQGWTGIAFDQKPANDGVFVFQMTVLFVDGTTRQYSGDITLVR